MINSKALRVVVIVEVLVCFVPLAALLDADGMAFDGELLWYMNVAWATPILVTAYLARDYLFASTGAGHLRISGGAPPGLPGPGR